MTAVRAIGRLAAIFGLTLVLVASPLLAQRDVRAEIKTITSYAVYYGSGRADDLARYDLAIIQPETLDYADLTALKAQGTLVVAYLSIGETDGDTRVPPGWILGQNLNWGSSFVDARKKGWQDLVIADAGSYISQDGFDGVFLDTVDTADLYPETAPGMIALMRRLRAAYPDALLIQNRGFSLLDQTVGSIDAVMFEDVVTSYDFDRKKYIRIDPDGEAVSQLHALQRQSGLVVLALDYAEAGDSETACFAVQNARDNKFVPAVSVIALDDLPDYHLAENCPA